MPDTFSAVTIRDADGSLPALSVVNVPTANQGLPAVNVYQNDTTGPAVQVRAGGTLLDLQTRAGTSLFKVDSNGNLVTGTAQGNVGGLAADNLLQAATSSVDAVSTTQITSAGTVYIGKLTIRQAVTATNVMVAVSGGGNNTNGSTGTFVGLYSSAGTLLSGSADCATALTGTGAISVALTTAQALTAGTFVWAAIVTNLGTTQPTLRVYAGNAGSMANAGLTAAVFRAATAGTSQTALPASITPASNVSGVPFWFAIT